jgi:hypothetical protein
LLFCFGILFCVRRVFFFIIFMIYFLLALFNLRFSFWRFRLILIRLRILFNKIFY